MNGAGRPPKPPPGWERRIASFLASKSVPHQWATSTGRPRCARCQEPVTDADQLADVPACDRCRVHVAAVLGLDLTAKLPAASAANT